MHKSSVIPFYSGARAFQKQWPDIESYVDRIISSGRFSNGDTVVELETEIQRFTGASAAIAVNNATDALVIVQIASGIEPEHEVICPVYSFFATASSVVHVGATPRFCDIDPHNYGIAPEQIEAVISSRTRAIMPVHLFTQMADMPAILDIAARHNLLVLEDSAEAIGMWLNGCHAGLLGNAGVLSFFPTKTLGALGDGGMILTNDLEIARKCRCLRDHGRTHGEGSEVIYPGFNSKMDEIQAAILLARLKYLPEETAKRAALAKLYDTRLLPLAPFVKTPTIMTRPYATNPIYYVYLIEAEWRNELAAYLNRLGIGTEVYYPIPFHEQPCFAALDYRTGDFPVAEQASRRTLALPLYPDLSPDQAEQVCDVIFQFYKERY